MKNRFKRLRGELETDSVVERDRTAAAGAVGHSESDPSAFCLHPWAGEFFQSYVERRIKAAKTVFSVVPAIYNDIEFQVHPMDTVDELWKNYHRLRTKVVDFSVK